MNDQFDSTASITLKDKNSDSKEIDFNIISGHRDEITIVIKNDKAIMPITLSKEELKIAFRFILESKED